MKALTYDTYGNIDAMRLSEVADPEPGPNDILVEVHAASINPIDWKVRAGALRSRFELKFPDVPGRDVSGVVRAAGAGVTDFAPGDEVFGVCPPTRWGSHAELVAVDVGPMAIKPAELNHVEAASLPLVGLTALTALENAAPVEAEMHVLIHAGAGGVGAFAIQYAKSRGAKVYATASAANFDYCAGLGADEVIDYTATDFEDVVADLDIVYDTIGGDTHMRSRRVLRPGGHLVCLNAKPVPDDPPPDDITVSFPVVEYTRAGVERIAALVAERAVRPTVEAVFSLDDGIEAYRLSETGHARGKVVIRVR